MLKSALIVAYVVSASLDLGIKPVLVFVPEGRVADQQNIEYHATSPNVNGLGVRLFFQDFGRQVARCAGEPEPCLLVTLDLDGQSEVGQLHSRAFLFARQQQILRLKRKKAESSAFKEILHTILHCCCTSTIALPKASIQGEKPCALSLVNAKCYGSITTIVSFFCF